MSTWITPFGVSGFPCEQPPPARSAKRVLPTKATSDTPSVSPDGRLLIADGSPLTTVVICPGPVILEIRAVGPPWYGPTGGGVCSQSKGPLAPPRPASAT